MLSELLRKNRIEGDAGARRVPSPSPKLAYDPFLLAMHAGVDLLDAIYSGSKNSYIW